MEVEGCDEVLTSVISSLEKAISNAPVLSAATNSLSWMYHGLWKPQDFVEVLLAN